MFIEKFEFLEMRDDYQTTLNYLNLDLLGYIDEQSKLVFTDIASDEQFAVTVECKEKKISFYERYNGYWEKAISIYPDVFVKFIELMEWFVLKGDAKKIRIVPADVRKGDVSVKINKKNREIQLEESLW